MAVTRCVCFDKTFAELKAVADHEDASTLEELQQHVMFGQNCKMCHPYVRRMLATGETVIRIPIETSHRDV